MDDKLDSIWFYFRRPIDNVVSCKHCKWSCQQDPTKSTGNQIRHLESKHSELDSQRKRAITESNKKKEEATSKIQKITSFVSSDPSSSEPPKEKRAKVLSIQDCFTQWNSDGEKTKKMDRLIAEMISVDILPLRLSEKIGFKRLINYVAPNYKLKGRTFYTEEISRAYDELFQRIKADIKVQEFISLTTDIWTSSHGSMSILSVTGHYIRYELSTNTFEPTTCVLSAQHIKGSHTGKNICERLQSSLDKMEIENFLN
ncbi:hypothetical protein ACQ4LE_007123 [Meloidogyne hapla]